MARSTTGLRALVVALALNLAVGFVARGLGSSSRLAQSRTRAQHTVVSMATDNPKKIIVFGGDGFCGWPTALHLSDEGHEVIIVDNLSRRNIDTELGCDSLTPIATPEQRVEAWEEVSGKKIPFINLDVAEEYAEMVQLLKEEKPDTVVHFAEQRAAPYSMRSPKAKRYTIDNNLGGTHNLMCAVVESELDIHVVHLGTMGVYGYGTSGGEIPEGYIDVILPGGRESKILHPAYPGSIYHATKCLDALLFQFYNKNDGLRCTDLHQGVVWGTNTPQTITDERLINRFDYDGDYGTVLNRFLMQAALDIPLTIYGTGGQTRAFIHITDTAKCIQLACENPPAAGAPVEILNQVAETRKVRDLAEMIAEKTGCELSFVNNPRNEAAENDLEVSNKKFRLLGLEPTTLDEKLFEEVMTITQKFKDRAILGKVMPSSYWNKKRTEDITEGRGAVLETKSLDEVKKGSSEFKGDQWGVASPAAEKEAAATK
jgi:UDP-sulfoquinovose synthase